MAGKLCKTVKAGAGKGSAHKLACGGKKYSTGGKIKKCVGKNK